MIQDNQMKEDFHLIFLSRHVTKNPSLSRDNHLTEQKEKRNVKKRSIMLSLSI